MSLQLKRVYDPPAAGDGVRVLVDRLWPRGVTKAAARLDDWVRAVAPSETLCRWFAHDPAKWPEFRRRYAQELKRNDAAVAPLAALAAKRRVTLLFGARDTAHNNAVALRAYLEGSAGGGALRGRSKTSRPSEVRSG